MKKEFILSCPCCGSRPIIEHYIEMEGGGARISCSCGLKMEGSDDFNSYHAEKEIIKKWNKINHPRTPHLITRTET